MSEPKVSFLTVNYKQPEVTLALMQSLQKLTYSNWEVVVVNNAPEANDELRKAVNGFANAIYLESGANLGFAGGNNFGLPHCKGDYIYFINNDTEVAPELIETTLRGVDNFQNWGMVSPKIKFFNEDNVIQYAGATELSTFTMRNAGIGWMETDTGQHNELRETAFIHGAAMLVPKTVIDEVGTMYDDYFLYYEEYDWCERIKQAGYKILYNGQATIYHKESVSTGVDSPLKVYYLTRNRLLFARRNFGGLRLFLIWLYFSLVAVPKNVVSWALKNRLDLTKAVWRGFAWNFTNK